MSPTLYSRPTTHPYGLTALSAALPTTTTSPTLPTFHATTFPVPNTPLAHRIDAYACAHLPPQTYRHSRRVFAWGCAVAAGVFAGRNTDTDGEDGWGRALAEDLAGRGEGEWKGKLVESWFLTAMLHDIGTVPSTLRGTRLSYEFWAGFEALRILQDGGRGAEGAGGGSGSAAGEGDKAAAAAPVEQAESVAEAIIRHQDVQDKGKITLLTRLVHIGTLLDNIGKGREWVSKETVGNVVKEWPRVWVEGDGGDEEDRKMAWTGCFRQTVEMEKMEKPYAMVTRIEGFEEAIEKNGRREGAFPGL